MLRVQEPYDTQYVPEQFNKETFKDYVLNICLRNKEKNVTSARKCLRRVDAKDESELFRVIKRL